MSSPLDATRPRDVEGYSLAAANGLVPHVGTAPPTPLPGVSARHRLSWLGARAGALFVLAVLTTSVLRDVPGAGIAVPVVFLGGGITLGVTAVRLQRRVYAELQHGYTTLRLQFGRAGGDRWKQTAVGGGRLSWDYRGTWFLGSDGSVRQAPDLTIDPPGFTPSPSDPTRLELWTGASWSGRFER